PSQNGTALPPSLVFITATSLDEFMGLFSSFFSSAAKTAEVNNRAITTENFILTNDTNAWSCRVKSRHPAAKPNAAKRDIPANSAPELFVFEVSGFHSRWPARR